MESISNDNFNCYGINGHIIMIIQYGDWYNKWHPIINNLLLRHRQEQQINQHTGEIDPRENNYQVFVM